MIDSELDLEHLKEEFDSLPEEEENFLNQTKKTVLDEIEKQAVAYYRLWSHATGKGLLEFFKMIGEAQGFISAYAPNMITKADTITLLDRNLVRIDLIQDDALDAEELEQSFELFDELHCSCGEPLQIDEDGDLYCGNCMVKRHPFDTVSKRRL